MLNTLTLTHFQKHAHLTHTFKPGLTLVTGPNWSGKTTILRAVLYALFGTSAVNVKAGNLVSRSNTGMEVSLAFQVGEQHYRVVWGPKKAELHQDSALVASGQNPVTAMIESLIGDAKSFLTFQTARQGEASGLLTLGAAKLAQHIDTVTGVDTVDQVLERAKAARDALAAVPQLVADAEREQQEYQNRLDALTLEVAPLQAELDAQRTSMRTALAETTQAQKKWECVSAGLAAYRDYQSAQDTLTQQLHAADTARLQAQTELQRLPEQDVTALYQRVSAMQAAVQAHAVTAHAWQSWQTQHEALAGRLEGLQAQSLNEVLPDLGEARERAEAAERDWQAALDAFSQAQQSLTLAACATCGRPFADHDVEAAHARLAAARLHVELQQPITDSVRVAYQHLQQQHTARNQHLGQIGLMREQLRQLHRPEEPGTAPDGSWLTDAQSQYQEAVRNQAARAHALKDLQAAEAAVSYASEHLAALVRQGEVTQSQVDQALREYHTAYGAYQTAEQAVADTQRQCHVLDLDLSGTQTALDRAAARLAPLQQQAQRSERLTQLMKYLRDSRERFTTHAWANLLAYASTFVQEASGGALTELRRTAGGEFTYVEDGEELPLELASGQQLAILGVAAKLALAAAVGSSFEVLLLDEVSAAASDDNALQLATCLARTGQQILLVSHRDADAAVAGDVIAL